MKNQAIKILFGIIILFSNAWKENTESPEVRNQNNFSLAYQEAKTAFENSEFEKVVNDSEQIFLDNQEKNQEEALAALVLKGQALKKMRKIPDAKVSFEKAKTISNLWKDFRLTVPNINSLFKRPKADSVQAHLVVF